MARPRLSKAAARRETLRFRVTPALRKEIAAAAREQEKPVAVVIRATMLAWAAERVAAKEQRKLHETPYSI